MLASLGALAGVLGRAGHAQDPAKVNGEQTAQQLEPLKSIDAGVLNIGYYESVRSMVRLCCCCTATHTAYIAISRLRRCSPREDAE